MFETQPWLHSQIFTGGFFSFFGIKEQMTKLISVSQTRKNGLIKYVYKYYFTQYI